MDFRKGEVSVKHVDVGAHSLDLGNVAVKRKKIPFGVEEMNREVRATAVHLEHSMPA